MLEQTNSCRITRRHPFVDGKEKTIHLSVSNMIRKKDKEKRKPLWALCCALSGFFIEIRTR